MWEAPGFITWDATTRVRSAGKPEDFQKLEIDSLSYGDLQNHEAGILNLRSDGGQLRFIPGREANSNMLNNDASPEVCSLVARFVQ